MSKSFFTARVNGKNYYVGAYHHHFQACFTRLLPVLGEGKRENYLRRILTNAILSIEN